MSQPWCFKGWLNLVSTSRKSTNEWSQSLKECYIIILWVFVWFVQSYPLPSTLQECFVLRFAFHKDVGQNETMKLSKRARCIWFACICLHRHLIDLMHPKNSQEIPSPRIKCLMIKILLKKNLTVNFWQPEPALSTRSAEQPEANAKGADAEGTRRTQQRPHAVQPKRRGEKQHFFLETRDTAQRRLKTFKVLNSIEWVSFFVQVFQQSAFSLVPKRSPSAHHMALFLRNVSMRLEVGTANFPW